MSEVRAVRDKNVEVQEAAIARIVELKKQDVILNVFITSIVVFAFLFRKHSGCVKTHLTKGYNSPLLLPQLATGQ